MDWFKSILYSWFYKDLKECSKEYQKTNRTKTLPFHLLVSVSTRTRKISEGALSVHSIQKSKNDEFINHINNKNHQGLKYKPLQVDHISDQANYTLSFLSL